MRNSNSKTNSLLSAFDDSGQPVDWWFAYKVSSKSESTDGSTPTGGE